MKKSIVILTFLAFIISLSYISASCTITPTLLSQDPSPVTPGDYVKLVFQVTGMQDPGCGTVTFQLVPEYPISFDPNASSYYTAVGGINAVNYNSFLTIPYTVRIDPDAVKGNDTIYFQYTNSNFNASYVSTPFNLYVQDVRTNFEVFVSNYDYTTHDLTLEVLNVGQDDADSLIVMMPEKQENATVIGPNTYVIGTLSSNDYTTADFKIPPNKGNLNLTLSYTDTTGVRRSVNETIYFDPTSFVQPKSTSSVFYFVIIILVVVVLYFIFKIRKKNKKKKLLRE